MNPRPDNGLINSSPISASAPIRRLIVGCTYSLSVHVDDPNGDEVRCRFGVDSSECGSICQGLPGATITSVRTVCNRNMVMMVPACVFRILALYTTQQAQ